LGMYLVTIIGNFLIILAISCDPHLHAPMYFFLANLSSVDICFSLCPQDAGESHSGHQVHLLHGVCDPDLLLHHFRQHGPVPPECHGL
jgi:hypothetical protein